MNHSSLSAPSGRRVIVALAGALTVFALTHLLPLPGTVQGVMSRNGGQTILDLQPQFTADGVYQRLADFGEDGRDAYFRMMLSMDILFPLAFTTFLVLWARYVVSRADPGPSLRRLLPLLPLGYLIADVAENLSIAWLIQAYPSRHDGLAGVLGYMTVVKRVCMIAALFSSLALTAWSLAIGQRQRN